MVRANDTVHTINKKMRLAAILGTIQATHTYFPYLRQEWTDNAKEEALLGVSMTGLYDNFEVCNNKDNLKTWKSTVKRTNKQFARLLGINQSAATTCVKPEGTVSQLVDAASGIHPRHSKYYIRTVRGDTKDPLTQFLIEKGVPNEPCVMKPDQTVVFSFPIAAPNTVTRKEITPIDHLDFWRTVNRFYCEHKPSVTINIEEDQWVEVGAYVWKHFDQLTGVSFLPYDGGTYQQAPYQECTKLVHDKAAAEMPEIDFDEFIEFDDTTTGVQQFACTAGVCELI